MAASRATVEIVATLRDSVTTPLKGIANGIRSVFSGIRGLVTGALVGAFAVGIKNVAQTQDAIGKMAKTVRDTTENVSALKFALDDLGIGSNNLKEILNQLEGKRSDALRGGGGVRSAFGRLGLDLEDLRKLGGVEILKRLGDAYNQAGRSAEAAAQLQRLFGDRFREFLPLLEQGSVGFEKIRARAEALGGVISQQDAIQSAEFAKQWLEFTTVATSLFRELANVVLPYITAAISEIKSLLKGVREFFNPTVAQELLRRFESLEAGSVPGFGLADARFRDFTESQRDALRQAQIVFEDLGKEGGIKILDDPRKAIEKLQKAIDDEAARGGTVKIAVEPVVKVERPSEFLQGFRDQIAGVRQELEDMYRFGQQVAEQTAGALSDNINRVLDGIRQGTIRTKDALRSLIDGLIEDFTRLAQQELVRRLLASALSLIGGAASSGGNANGGGGGTTADGGGLGYNGGFFSTGGGGNKRFGGFGRGGGTTINLSSNSTQEEQRELVRAIMLHEQSRNRQVRVAFRTT